MTLEVSDLDVMKDSALKRFDERVAKAGSSDRSEIELEAARLESSLTALMARREPEMAQTVQLWERLVKICDVFAARISQLSKKYSVGSMAYDNVLDIRSAAEELRALHSP